MTDLGLAIRIQEGLFVPVLLCDTCNQPIEDWQMGIAAHPSPPTDNVMIPISTFHKGDCDPGGGPQREERARMWQELDHYLPWLFWNNNWGRKLESSQEGEPAKLTIDVPPPLW